MNPLVLLFAADAAKKTDIDATLQQSKSILSQLSDTFFNARSVITFLIAIAAALIVGRIVAMFLRRLTNILGNRADKSDNLATVTRLRRYETLIVLSIAIIRILLVLFAMYFWWSLIHHGQQSTAVLGASAIVAIIVTGAISPILRDFAYGAVMMAEHWYGVGDHISVDPLVDGQGIVERVTLRSTRIRGVNGEVIWVNNQNIWAVRVTPKGVRTIAVELFVSNLDKGIRLIEETNIRLPIGALVVVNPLSIMTQIKVGSNLWHITALAEVAPGREWLLDDFAVKVMQEIDEADKVLVHKPITRYADSEAERRFARTIRNSRKPRLRRQSVAQKVATQRVKLEDRKRTKNPKTVKAVTKK